MADQNTKPNDPKAPEVKTTTATPDAPVTAVQIAAADSFGNVIKYPVVFEPRVTYTDAEVEGALNNDDFEAASAERQKQAFEDRVAAEKLAGVVVADPKAK